MFMQVKKRRVRKEKKKNWKSQDVTYTKGRIERLVVITEEKLEESIKRKTLAMMKDIQVLKPINDSLSIMFTCFLFPLNLHQETPKLRSTHKAILRVPLEYRLYLRWCLRRPQPELPATAKAHFVCLLRHYSTE